MKLKFEKRSGKELNRNKVEPFLSSKLQGILWKCPQLITFKLNRIEFKLFNFFTYRPWIVKASYPWLVWMPSVSRI